MKNKEKYYKALIENRGQFNEIEVGEQLGLHETETSEIITQLLSEYRIEYAINRSCNYSLTKKGMKKKSRT
ncbi:MAG: hypothetical protein LBV59_00535 [Sphingobacterium sp.]|jgi:predicted transcriptional regulator|uniref:hypothetical protein n=1 Tax=Sphingobacterium sp. TaxID=341027 RepID=UPI00283E3D4F|nr:hypothetical protein [Sphingobacterium sp.]MDR3006386.1 hypothetical protein [Sphingobacterium sp.]